MKRVIAVILTVIFITLLLPLAVVWLMDKTNTAEEFSKVQVYMADEEKTVEMDINEYLKCAVSAEMPVSFEEEALKAQAVAARTYLYSHIKSFEDGKTDGKHSDAPICTDSTHCQAYITEKKRKESWGDTTNEKWDKISSAVDETSNEIMVYDGEIISAVFHSTSSGRTESAKDVWGKDVEYLKSVESEGDKTSPKFNSELIVSENEFKKTASEKIDGTDWSKGLATNIERSASGGIISLDVGGINIKGTEFRNIFSLQSTNVEVFKDNENIKMTVKGYGHGVGMSQYGANYLAKEGKGYDEILKTYYSGVEIVKR